MAAIFLSRFTVKPSIAASSPPTTTIQEDEKTIVQHEHHITALKTIMETIKHGKVDEAIVMLNQLVTQEDSEPKQSYHIDEMKSVEKRILEEMQMCKTWAAKNVHSLKALMAMGHKYYGSSLCYKRRRKIDRVKDFKLVVAQVHAMQGNYNEALKIYQDLSEEEPEDLKPYLYQGIMYTLLGRKDESEINFAKVEEEIPGKMKKSEYITNAVGILLVVVSIGMLTKLLLDINEKDKGASS